MDCLAYQPMRKLLGRYLAWSSHLADSDQLIKARAVHKISSDPLGHAKAGVMIE